MRKSTAWRHRLRASSASRACLLGRSQATATATPENEHEDAGCDTGANSETLIHPDADAARTTTGQWRAQEDWTRELAKATEGWDACGAPHVWILLLTGCTLYFYRMNL